MAALLDTTRCNGDPAVNKPRRLSLRVTLVGSLLLGVGLVVMPPRIGIAQQHHPAALGVPAHATPAQATLPPVVEKAFAAARLHAPRNLRQRGPNYTAEGLTAAGLPARIVIHGETGAILGLRILDGPVARDLTGSTTVHPPAPGDHGMGEKP